jgi:acetolactate synthase-1/2/3 large subunit
MLGHNRRKMLGAECMADMLRDYGVTHVFHVPAVLRRSFVEMERRSDIKRLHVHGEKSAAYMADGYARATGKPGICMAQVIGALNLAAGLRDAWLAHSPVIAMTGGREPRTKFRKVYQEIDDMPAFEPVTKFNATVDDVSRFPDMLRQAFRVAVSPARRARCISSFAATKARSMPRRRRWSPFARRSSLMCRRSGRSRTRRACSRRSRIYRRRSGR